MLFAGSLYTFTAALHYSTLGAVITWRNLAPLPTMFVECCCFSHARLALALTLALVPTLPLALTLALALALASPLPLALTPTPTPTPTPTLALSRYRATCSSIVGLVVIFAGVMIYGFADSQFSVLGTSLVVVNTVGVVLETLSKRHLMTNQTNPLQLTRQAMMLVSNLIGVILVATAAACVGEWGKLGAELYELRAGEASYIFCGGEP